MGTFFSQWRFSLLLLALVGNILLAPLLGHIPSLIAFTLLLITIVLVIGKKRWVIAIYTATACLALITAWMSITNAESSSILLASNIFSFFALLFAMSLIITNIFSSDTVTIDTIAESLCAYLLLGLAFAYVYTLIDIIYPYSFISSLNNEYISFSLNQTGLDTIYFSFITLLTVGYGDIVPASHPAKLTTIIEGFFGQIYLVVLIARLVGMHVSQSNNNH